MSPSTSASGSSQIAADVRQRSYGERRQSRGAEAEHEPYSADDQFAGGRACAARSTLPIARTRGPPTIQPTSNPASAPSAIAIVQRAQGEEDGRWKGRAPGTGRDPGCLRVLPGGRRPASRSASRSTLLIRGAGGPNEIGLRVRGQLSEAGVRARQRGLPGRARRRSRRAPRPHPSCGRTAARRREALGAHEQLALAPREALLVLAAGKIADHAGQLARVAST